MAKRESRGWKLNFSKIDESRVSRRAKTDVVSFYMAGEEGPGLLLLSMNGGVLRRVDAYVKERWACACPDTRYEGSLQGL